MQNNYYHHGLRKNYSGTVKWGQVTNKIYTNSLGFRDKEVRSIVKNSNGYRILFIGDSFTEGAGLPYEQTFVGKYSKSMESGNIEVFNAGVVSYSPKIYYLRLKQLIEIEDLEFNELFVFIDISDIQDEIDYSAWTPVNETWLRKMDAYVRSISFTYKLLRDNILNTKKFGVLKKIIRSIEVDEGEFKRHVVSGIDSGNNSDNLQKEELEGVIRMPDGYIKNWAEQRPQWTYNDQIYQKWGETGLKVAKHHMDKVYKLMQQYGIKMHIAVYPWPHQIKHHDLNSRQEKAWRKFSDERNIGFISYFPEFVKEDKEEVIKKYFIPGDIHWNERGHEIVYQKLKKYDKEHGGRTRMGAKK